MTQPVRSALFATFASYGTDVSIRIAIKYVQPPSPGQGGDGELVTTTVRDYDLQQLASQQKQALIGVAILGFMHLYMK